MKDLLSRFAFHIPITLNMLIGIFLVLLVIWLMHMVIIQYHWKNYGNDKLRVLRMNIYYFIGSGILFSSLAFFLVLYSSSLSS